MEKFQETRGAWARFKESWREYRRARRALKALALIERAERIDPNILAEIFTTMLTLTADRIQTTEPDSFGVVRVDMTDALNGPWGRRV